MRHFQGLLAGLIVGAVGGYFLHKNRRRFIRKWWMLKARAELDRRLKQMKKLSKSSYEDLVDSIIDRYRTVSSVAAYELDQFADELKSRFNEAKRRFGEGEEEEEERS